MNYIVVIGDLVQSKKLNKDSRKLTQESLKSIFQKINGESSDLASPYTITLGDEFQAVYRAADDLFTHLWMIFSAIHPVFVRFSIAVGEISTEINTEQALGMDGPVFHMARKQIEHLKEKKRLLAFSTDQERFNRLINSTLRILEKDLRTWKKNRFKILYRYQAGTDVKKIAGEVNLSDVAVYKNINAGALDAISELTNTISETINDDFIR